MDFVTPLYRTLQAAADLDRTRATTRDIDALSQQRVINTQLLGEQLKETLATNQALTRAFGGQSPTMPPQFIADPEDSPAVAAQKNVSRLQWDARQSQKLADDVAAAGGSPKVVLDLRKRATDAGWRATQGAREALAERNDIQRDIGGWARAVTDADSFNFAMRNIGAVDPQMVKTLPLDRDQFGAPVWGPRSQQTMKSVGTMAQTANEQTKAEIAASNAEARARDAETRANNAQMREQLIDAQTARAQAQGELAKARAENVGKTGAKGTAGQKAATTTQVKAADSVIDGEFPDAKFDNTRARFAADIADRANKIVADSRTRGEEVGYDDARDQAFNELKGFVTDRKVTVKEGFSIFGKKLGEDETRTVKTYTRGRKEAPAAEGGEATGGLPEIKTEDDYNKLPKGAEYTFNGKRGVKR